ncbi:circularly permuted type 2 ATP-grasp protein [Bacillus sp. ISL-46]|uniref:circularly permuted type 2 ATP-grasp protein n=1 Tax=Bacillus sp. ISL-46 TaxID=2819129 RepID=UPI001BECA9EB|nr:circularly permuted type 2 ATP-grasp protein [Bacillus sp. ISL-46]MBT2719859.1 circularly permuted type 2 ATP-grasp protein [Bacillus sp. ISL-46]
MSIPLLKTVQTHSFSNYTKSSYYDEMFDQFGTVRTPYESVFQRFSKMGANELDNRNSFLQSQMIKQGITFTLYNENPNDSSLERTIPFDMIPRIVTSDEWSLLEKGLKQRICALNQFIYDVYHEQNILKDNIIPRNMVITNPYFCKEMTGMNIPNNVYIPISGIDLIRSETGDFYVLEDNVRTPSGLSYVYKNRSLMVNLFSELYFNHHVRDIDQSLNILLSSLRSLAPQSKKNPTVVLLTPGIHNSAYFEHTYLAQEMGIELVEGKDLIVHDQRVYLKSLDGLHQVDVIYRRIDDEYLDPLTFRPDSLLGVPGLMNVYRAGHVAIANAPGTGIADDKAIYNFVPEMIRYYLNEEPILKNVPTYILSNQVDREYVLNHLPEMVVKERSLSGGYGMLIGPTASELEISSFAKRIIRTPEKFIAQPTMKLSTSPSVTNKNIAPCHIDLRAFVFMGKDVHVVPGGLTRVALKDGSLVVNSSQGGGTKDTWVLESLINDENKNEVKEK